MAVFRVERNTGYTVMSNHHLRNKELSLKAKGLLSQMLSLPEDWDYTLAGLSYINRESIDAIRTAVWELEKAGYITRRQGRDEKGKMTAIEYTIYEQPQPPELDCPVLEKPTADNPILENPTTDNPTSENPTQLNKDISRTNLPKKEKSNTDLSITHSIPIHSLNPLPYDGDEAAEPPERKRTERNDAYRVYEEIIKDNIAYDILLQDRSLDRDRLNEIVDLMLETVCTARKKIRIAGDDYPAELVKSKFMKLNSEHIRFVLDCMQENTTKIRNIKKAKGLSGKPVTSKPVYGYLMDEDENFIIDEEAAPVVKQIYQLCLAGNGPTKIARMLTEQQIPTPGTLEYQRTGSTRRYHPGYECKWATNTVVHLLENREYTGCLVNFKTEKPSYKMKHSIDNPIEKQAIFENHHEPIIDLQTWERVQELRKQRKRPNRYDDVGLFSGLLFCADCGHVMYQQRYQTDKRKQDCYICGSYKKRTADCTAHFIRTDLLTAGVLDNLRKVTAYAQKHEARFVKLLIQQNEMGGKRKQAAATKQLEQVQSRIAELSRYIKRLYEDNVNGKISDERFMEMSADYEAEQRELKEKAAALQGELDKAQEATVNAEKFMNVVRKYLSIEELTHTLLREMVEKIVVYECEYDENEVRHQRIDIYYSFVGKIDLPEE